MRILVYGISNEKGGISEYMMNINSEAIKKEIYFDYIIKGLDSVYEENIENMSGKVYYYNYLNKLERMINIYKIISENRNEYDYFYYNTSGTYFIIPVLVAKLCGYKIISHAHNSEEKNLNKLYKMLNLINRKYLYKKSILKFKCSDLAGEWVFGKKQKDVIQINNGIDLNKFKYNEKSREIKRKELGIKDDEIILICIGRLEYPKNQKFLIDIMKSINDQNKYHLLLVGQGKDKESLKKYAEDNNIKNIYFLGTRYDIPELLSASDLFLLPSLFEGFPIVSVEAQASGLKCLLSENITKQADITGLVTYISLDKKQKWIEEIKGNYSKNRIGVIDILEKAKFNKRKIGEEVACYIINASKKGGK